MDGLKLAKEVHLRWPHIQLLLASGYARPGKAEIPDDGHFVPKPYDTVTVIRHIQELMAGRLAP